MNDLLNPCLPPFAKRSADSDDIQSLSAEAARPTHLFLAGRLAPRTKVEKGDRTFETLCRGWLFRGDLPAG